MKKKFMALLLTAAMLTSYGTMVNAATKDDPYEIYLITMDQIDQHWVNVNKGCEKAVAELENVKYKWSAPDTKDDAKQIECVNNAVADNADAILLAANGPDAVTAAVKAADEAGVKIVYVDSAANYDAVQTLATDNKQAGVTAGEQMLAALKEAGIEEGKIGIISPNASTHSNVSREEGFRESFEGTAFELLETQYSEGDAAKSKDMAANYIVQGCVGIFGTNEGCTIGVGNAVKESGGSVIGVGFDKSDMIAQLIKEGSLKCSIVQNPDVMGYEGMMTAYKVLEGGTVEEDYVDTGASVMNADNVEELMTE